MAQEPIRPVSPNAPLSHEKLAEGLRSRIRFDRNSIDALADWMTSAFGTVTFLVCNILFFAGWIYWNNSSFGLPVFDPFPYQLLTMAVSLEAIVLSIIVLISQNRQAKMTEIRQKVNFEIDVRAEEEVTKLIELVLDMHKHLGLKTEGVRKMAWMRKEIDIEKIRKEVEETKDA